jgi:hypothetical protein
LGGEYFTFQYLDARGRRDALDRGPLNPKATVADILWLISNHQNWSDDQYDALLEEYEAEEKSFFEFGERVTDFVDRRGYVMLGYGNEAVLLRGLPRAAPKARKPRNNNKRSPRPGQSQRARMAAAKQQQQEQQQQENGIESLGDMMAKAVEVVAAAAAKSWPQEAAPSKTKKAKVAEDDTDDDGDYVEKATEE